MLVTAPGLQSESFEAASLQLGALQAQAQYAPSALQGARAASRSAASCLVTAVQYTHGQQVLNSKCIQKTSLAVKEQIHAVVLYFAQKLKYQRRSFANSPLF